MEPITAFFPFWPPSVNHGWRHVGNRTLISAAGRDFRREIEKYALTLRSDKKLPLESLSEKLDVSMVLYPPDARRRDLDNYFKAVFDAMTHARLWQDDSQICQLSATWGARCKGGGFSLIVKPFVDGPNAD